MKERKLVFFMGEYFLPCHINNHDMVDCSTFKFVYAEFQFFINKNFSVSDIIVIVSMNSPILLDTDRLHTFFTLNLQGHPS